LQRLANGLEILSAIGLLKGLAVLIRATLAERGQRVEVGLSGSQVAGLQILPNCARSAVRCWRYAWSC